ncbi:MAG TPA: formate--tetrahydrofolate ligase, partial [Clostridia bacterium]|nr:formate--tetrahydrofolate ligase [Clostridia bacterium]
LGAEKFLDIKCRVAGLKPSAVVIVATVRALKHHGGAKKEDLGNEDLTALEAGIPNLLKHIENITVNFGLPAVVAINRFPTDSEKELKLVEDKCRELGVNVALSEVWAKGSAGGEDLAKEVARLVDEDKGKFTFAYDTELGIKEKITAIVQKIYGGDGVDFTPDALKSVKSLEKQGFGKLPICMAKTQYSLSDDPLKKCRPAGFTVTVRGIKVSAGAGFLVALTGEIMTMPGLPKVPSAELIDVDNDGKITGLF